eukprot:NODE_619_length_1443_cov_283.439481.p1 GENE.NODE_619_length_1443_cov_283.439481~~NODE_619_length_1443_cov_283.439481.p1  ORF type:complete len:421 (+),score=155.18 NODE_619_length_1443_cov_283.439481:3-1265(+)
MGCLGGLCAVGCCKLATGGHTNAPRAASCLLVWLQVLTAVSAYFMTLDMPGWFAWPCDKLHDAANKDIGICACRPAGDEAVCFRDQVIYRTQCAVFVVFAVLLLLSISGCAQSAASACPIMKFMATLLGTVALFFFPNDLLSVFGDFAGVASSVFLALQTVLLIDFAYTWSETWHTKIIEARERDPASRAQKAWLVGILGSAALLLLVALGACVYLCIAFDTTASRVIAALALVLALALLGLSISDFCPHGAVLASAVVAAYSMWLAYEALAAMPISASGGKEGEEPVWLGLAIAAVSLVASAHASGKIRRRSPRDVEAAGGSSAAVAPETGEPLAPAAAAVAEDEEEAEELAEATAIVPKEFMQQCFMHACAALYVCSVLAPYRGWGSFSAHTVALAAGLLLYGWTLVAPKVLRSRNFD